MMLLGSEVLERNIDSLLDFRKLYKLNISSALHSELVPQECLRHRLPSRMHCPSLASTVNR
jgi:hypothetical protein